jgi:hypothetical protein
VGIGELVAVVGGWSVVVIGVSAWLSRLVAERVLSAWRRDEQLALETLRNELASSRAVLEAAIRSHATGQDLSHQKRLASVERLWIAVLQLRERLTGPVFFFGILLPSEYDSAVAKDGPLAAAIANLSDDTIVAAARATSAIESDRPHLGETLWLQFFIYRAFLCRLAYLVVEGKRRGHIEDWRDDSGVRQLLGHVLSEQHLRSLIDSKTDPQAVNRAVNLLESLMLKEISLISSGQRSAFESFENAKQLREALASVKASGV